MTRRQVAIAGDGIDGRKIITSSPTRETLDCRNAFSLLVPKKTPLATNSNLPLHRRNRRQRSHRHRAEAVPASARARAEDIHASEFATQKHDSGSSGSRRSLPPRLLRLRQQQQQQRSSKRAATSGEKSQAQGFAPDAPMCDHNRTQERYTARENTARRRRRLLVEKHSEHDAQIRSGKEEASSSSSTTSVRTPPQPKIFIGRSVALTPAEASRSPEINGLSPTAEPFDYTTPPGISGFRDDNARPLQSHNYGPVAPPSQPLRMEYHKPATARHTAPGHPEHLRAIWDGPASVPMMAVAPPPPPPPPVSVSLWTRQPPWEAFGLF